MGRPKQSKGSGSGLAPSVARPAGKGTKPPIAEQPTVSRHKRPIDGKASPKPKPVRSYTKPPIQLDPTIPAWARQPTESGPAYHAFECYRDLGLSRSLNQAESLAYPHRAENRRKPSNLSPDGCLIDWSSRYLWVERCRQWDNHARKHVELTDAQRKQASIDKALAWRDEVRETSLGLARRLHGEVSHILGSTADTGLVAGIADAGMRARAIKELSIALEKIAHREDRASLGVTLEVDRPVDTDMPDDLAAAIGQLVADYYSRLASGQVVGKPDSEST